MYLECSYVFQYAGTRAPDVGTTLTIADDMACRFTEQISTSDQLALPKRSLAAIRFYPAPLSAPLVRLSACKLVRYWVATRRRL